MKRVLDLRTSDVPKCRTVRNFSAKVPTLLHLRTSGAPSETTFAAANIASSVLEPKRKTNEKSQTPLQIYNAVPKRDSQK